MKVKAIIVPDGNYWYVQGISEDYGVQGDSQEEAKEYFCRGLASTIKLRKERNFQALSGPPPPELLVELNLEGGQEIELEVDA